MKNSRTKIKFNFDTMKWEGLTLAEIKTWEGIYTEVDIADALKRMIYWLDKVKGTKKANKRNWRSFIVRWLKREQMKAVGII